MAQPVHHGQGSISFDRQCVSCGHRYAVKGFYSAGGTSSKSFKKELDREVQITKEKLNGVEGRCTYGVICPCCNEISSNAAEHHFPDGWATGLRQMFKEDLSVIAVRLLMLAAIYGIVAASLNLVFPATWYFSHLTNSEGRIDIPSLLLWVGVILIVVESSLLFLGWRLAALLEKLDDDASLRVVKRCYTSAQSQDAPSINVGDWSRPVFYWIVYSESRHT